jgi:sugar phosphate isomerase/epimerase
VQLSVCPQPLYRLGLPGALDALAGLGLCALELPVDARSPLVNLDELLAGGHKRLAAELRARSLSLSAISNHQEGQLLLGPHGADTDAIFAGTPEEKARRGRERLLASARLAAEMQVPVLVGFTGCEDWSRFFPWPDARGWEDMAGRFAEAVGPLLDELDKLGVSFAQEAHPKQMVYDVETALQSVQLLRGHKRWGFNLDSGNLWLVGADPVAFAQALAGRVLHVHAKDAELPPHNAARSSRLAHGAWDRPDRGFRFRVPGWGEVPWKRLISELRLGGYDGWLAIEHEDPVFGPLDGLRQAVATLAPLLPREPRAERWW